MTKFIYGLDEGASEMRKALVAQELLKRFPDIEFQCVPAPNPLLENNIIPLVGGPHPTDPDCAMIQTVPDELRDRVVEAFEDILAETAAAAPS